MTKIIGTDPIGPAVSGSSTDGDGVYGSGVTGVAGISTVGGSIVVTGSEGIGVFGSSAHGEGVFAYSIDGVGVFGQSTHGPGVAGTSIEGTGVHGDSIDGEGVFGQSTHGPGVAGTSIEGTGVFGFSTEGDGVFGFSDGIGVRGLSASGLGVFGSSARGVGVWGRSATGIAGLFQGGVWIQGPLAKSGGGFQIDHPLDPANKYLSHSFVESPDMKNLYDGVVVLDAQGEAIVDLPSWFEALNQEFRYQLTPIGAPGPNLHIAEEISDRRFKIAGGVPGMKVCWQVTGSRKDAWAQANSLVVEQEKSAAEQDHYLHPELYGYSQERSIAWVHHPEALRGVVEDEGGWEFRFPSEWLDMDL